MSIFNISLTVLLARIIVLVTAIPVHEYAHAWAAERMGDHTARYNRRLSFNPLNHLSPLGAMMILFFGFGFANPSHQLHEFYRPQKGHRRHEPCGPGFQYPDGDAVSYPV